MLFFACAGGRFYGAQGLELELWLMFERHRGKTTNEVVVQLDEHHAVGVGTAVWWHINLFIGWKARLGGFVASDGITERLRAIQRHFSSIFAALIQGHQLPATQGELLASGMSLEPSRAAGRDRVPTGVWSIDLLFPAVDNSIKIMHRLSTNDLLDIIPVEVHRHLIG